MGNMNNTFSKRSISINSVGTNIQGGLFYRVCHENLENYKSYKVAVTLQKSCALEPKKINGSLDTSKKTANRIGL